MRRLFSFFCDTTTCALSWSLRTFSAQPAPTGTATGGRSDGEHECRGCPAGERECGRARHRERLRTRRLADPARGRLAQVEAAGVLDVRPLDRRPVDPHRARCRALARPELRPGRRPRETRRHVDVLGGVANAAVLDVSAGVGLLFAAAAGEGDRIGGHGRSRRGRGGEQGAERNGQAGDVASGARSLFYLLHRTDR